MQIALFFYMSPFFDVISNAAEQGFGHLTLFEAMVRRDGKIEHVLIAAGDRDHPGSQGGDGAATSDFNERPGQIAEKKGRDIGVGKCRNQRREVIHNGAAVEGADQIRHEGFTPAGEQILFNRAGLGIRIKGRQDEQVPGGEPALGATAGRLQIALFNRCRGGPAGDFKDAVADGVRPALALMEKNTDIFSNRAINFPSFGEAAEGPLALDDAKQVGVVK